MNEKFSTGTTPWVWVTYDALIGDKEENLQVIEWPNGEGITIIKNDESEVHFTWDEWYALKKAMNRLGKDEQKGKNLKQ